MGILLAQGTYNVNHKYNVIFPFQYYSAWSNYEEAIKYLVTVPKYRIQATEIAKGDGLLKRDKKLDKGKTKEQIKEEDERVCKFNFALLLK